MGKNTQNMNRAAVSRYNRDWGREEIPIPAGPLTAMDGVLAFFSVIAYPDLPQQRVPSFKALHQWRLKHYIRQRGNQRRIRRLLRPDVGWMDKETTGSIVYRTLNRIERRLKAGSSAWALYRDDVPAFGPNPTTQSGMGLRLWHGHMGSIEQCMSYLTQEERGPEKEIVPDKQLGAHKRLTDNNRRLIWNESLPVLHLAVTLHFAFARLDASLSDREKLFTLLHNWWWLPDALESAEWWRVHLPKHVPFTDAHPFNPDQAIILKPVLLSEEPADK